MSSQQTNEEIAMMIVAHAGEAKSLAVNAITKAEVGDFESADEMMAKAHDALREAGTIHFQALTKEANGGVEITLLLIHAEDQFLSTDTILVLAEKIINVYKNR